MKKLMKKCVLIFFGILAIIWIIAFAKCEICTLLYSDDFENVVYDGVEFGDNPKIISYSDVYAKVYYIGERSELVAFVRRKGEWQVSSHRTVKEGKGDVARIFVLPYFWHYITE